MLQAAFDPTTHIENETLLAALYMFSLSRRKHVNTGDTTALTGMYPIARIFTGLSSA
jgi:hypothetical protein